ncbi:MAG: glycosyltransferase [Magnetococcales bacterium]|nr:glycosyltransferase [Magnetococcales bacterium]
MRILFINPQGNFDPADSHLTEHPDFGGQLVYVKETALAMARMGIQADIITRRIQDPDWPEFSESQDRYEGYPDNPRIIRIDCGGQAFLNKEQLWEHIPEFVDGIIQFYGEELPHFATAHYGDGGYAAALLKKKVGIPYTLTGHSLGAQKLDKLKMSLENYDQMEEKYRFSVRIQGERLAMEGASTIITSTSQERFEQYGHPLYEGSMDPQNSEKFSVIPPGVNTELFTTQSGEADPEAARLIQAALGDTSLPTLLVSSRLDEKKNHLEAVRAYVDTPALQKKANLLLAVRGAPDPYTDISMLSTEEQRILQPILQMIRENRLEKLVRFIDIRSQTLLAAVYRQLAKRSSIFILTAFYEPFGLAPIEAAACGLAVVATQNGGPSEIFARGEGVLCDPYDAKDIAKAYEKALENAPHLSQAGRRLVLEKYTWDRTAENYLKAIRRPSVTTGKTSQGEETLSLEGEARLKRYLSQADKEG